MRTGFLVLVLVLTACGTPEPTPGVQQGQDLAVTDRGTPEPTLDEQQVRDLAWQALEPNTSSHDRANWEATEVRQVSGQEVAEMLAGETGWACPGPTPPANREIAPSGRYWLVEMKKRPATPIPRRQGESSPTAPPLVPEPFIYQALFLVDTNGQVVARQLVCVVY